jgi:hypothetical protein
MSQRIAFLLFALSLSVYSCAEEGAVEHGWTDKNSAEMYAAYRLQHSYNEQGYWGAKVEIRQSGTKRPTASTNGLPPSKKEVPDEQIGGAQFDQVHAQVRIEVKFMEGGPKPSPNNQRP